MSEDSTLDKIIGIITQPGKPNSERVRSISRLLEREGVLDAEAEGDPFREYRSRAIEVTDLDGLPTFVSVGVLLERVEQGWVPGLLALAEAEARALDHVLTIWEHEVRARLRRMVQDPDQERGEAYKKNAQLTKSDQPWAVLGDMIKQQEAYRARLKLPKHQHGECCTHYEEVADHALAATHAGGGEIRRRK